MASLGSSLPPPPPSLECDDDVSISTTSTTSSSGERNNFLPKLFHPKFENRSRGVSPPLPNNNNSMLGGGDHSLPPPPPPLWEETRPVDSGATAPQSSQSAAAGSALGPLAPPGEMAPAVPTYPSSKRMLMRSPLPSPKPLKKILRPQPAIRQGSSSTEDSDSESDRKKREDTAMKRLVQMAKQQQNFAVAWFAASAGEEPMLPAMIPKASKQRARPRTKVSPPQAGRIGPIDLDLESSGQDTDDDQSTASSKSSASSKMRSFLNKILPTSNNNNNDGGDDDDSRVSRNSSSSNANSFVQLRVPSSDQPHSHGGGGGLPVCHENDESTAQSSSGSDSCGNGGNKLIQRMLKRPAILMLLLLSIVSVTGAAILFAQADAGGNDETDENANSIERDSTDTPAPTMQYSTPPSLRPSWIMADTDGNDLSRTSVPSQPPVGTQSPAPSGSSQPTSIPSEAPSMTPTVTASMSPTSDPTGTPSEKPSTSPSVSPTALPSLVPSLRPTSVPSISPTISVSPSSAPSLSPTTNFFTTVFNQLDFTEEGLQDAEQYGYSISLSSDGKVLAVGSRNFAMEGKRSSGKVQIYDMNDFNEWKPRGNPMLGENSMDQFGFAIALSSDGSRVAVSEPGLNVPNGAARSGSVRVFDWNGDAWTQVGNNIYGEARSDYFGISLALSGDGKRLVAAAPYHEAEIGPSKAGRVRVLEYSPETDTWNQIGDAIDGTGQLEWFGWDVDLSKDGNTVAIGAPRNSENGGYVRCFKWNSDNMNWSQLGDDIANNLGNVQLDDRFGMSLSLSAKGDRVAVGAPWKDIDTSQQNSGLVAVYQFGDISDDPSSSSNGWSLMGEPFEGSSLNHQLGWSLDLSGADGDFLAIGIPGHSSCGTNCGHVTFHRWDGNLWDSTSTPLTGDDERDDFGWAVASSEEGAIVAVGAVQTAGGKGYARMFRSSDNY
mmetsp:Transcript_11364/g.17582  ORF Transcript_11364/g.17582 Transcript_11364/m.17582 type:complete len:943 (+) Transcript_11364:231-3059(+)|eukprot:CAMPEP_0195303698 /NCGR_PEP_ID=MMETSP0707-20130614/33201_1 /TAXON_ID=33640 /ORGANISM="Asterionellopsis glacialis, Strain CCMP134" /LENGTH=942 /DNA_ID=CAMNT_0040367317 /DNA_START=295 /DNA_END=3123 /DNA_ORIENTATION=+